MAPESIGGAATEASFWQSFRLYAGGSAEAVGEIMKLREVYLLAEAVDDLAQGRSFYDAQEPGVGDYFVESVLGDLAVLRLHAGIHRRVYGFHRLLCLTFPFAVYYEISVVGVKVAAVLDMRRNPTWIRESLGQRQRKNT